MNNDNLIQVSILMPIYKVEQYLEKTLDSIFSQTYPALYFVFVDDCSPDHSIQVLQDAIAKHQITSDRYTIIAHEQNEGIAVSRADCIAHAKGDYIYFVDSDDWIEKDTVEQMVKATQGGTVDIVGCDYMKDFESGKITLHREKYAEDCYENMMRCLNYDIATVLWKLLIRRSLFEHIVITPHVDIVEDYIISVKLYYYANTFKAVPRAFYHYVQYNQARVSFQSLRSVTMHIKGIQEVEGFLREHELWNERVERLMLLRKFNVKSNFLTQRLLDYSAYRRTFPEADGVWRQINYSKKEKLKFWLAEHRWFLLLKLLQ